MTRKPQNFELPEQKASDYFGELTFNRAAMAEYLTGATAEKHDAFIDPAGGGRAIEKFRGSELSQQEPDASSFPSGGIRSTLEARGYTAWDPTSPAFIMNRTLCIPTVFVSYTGEALDYKTPLLKALYAIDQAALEVCRYFDKRTGKVYATLGWEQEYFLVDRALYLARPDLVLTGRTLFGHASAKDQQLEDHYFGTIPQRVLLFMQEFEYEAHRLGIPVKTRHNEVAPNQFECAPVFEEVNLSVDHNQLLMHLLEKVARRHDFTLLLHEKPYSVDNTDRNRTSPFAFTGNKFEFRAVGSSQSCASPMIALNLIVADQLRRFKTEVDELVADNIAKDQAIFRVVKKYITESRHIRFEGNNYSEDWAREAEKRGLPNMRNAPEALRGLIAERSTDLFVRNRVLTQRELSARFEIGLEEYVKKIQIESRVLGDLAGNHILPVAIRYQNTLIDNVRGLKQVLDVKSYAKLSQNQLEMITEISEHVDRIKSYVIEMIEARKEANRISGPEERAAAYCHNVLPFFEKIRRHVDKLELMVDDELWPLPKYRELLFTR